MGMEMKLNLKMSQRLVMTPMLQQAIKLLPMARLELAQLVRQEIIDNPILEEILQEDSDDEFNQENEEIEQDFKEETLAEVGQEILPEFHMPLPRGLCRWRRFPLNQWTSIHHC